MTNTSSIETIDKKAFMNTKITSIDLSGYTRDTIPSQAFEGCVNLADITISSGVKYIDFYAFRGCESITDLSAFTNVVSIGDSAFSETGITEFTAWRALETLCYGAFMNCVSLASIDLSQAADNFTFSEGYVFAGCVNLSGKVTIPKSVSIIHSNMFANTKISELDIEDGGTSKVIGYAFRDMRYLKKADLVGATGMNQGKNTSGFQYGTFCDTPLLEELILSVDYTMSAYGTGAMLRNMIVATTECYNEDPSKWSENPDLYIPTKYYLPKNLHTLRLIGIEKSAPYKYDLWTVKNVIYDDTLKEISEDTLSGMTGMLNLTMPNCEIVGEDGIRDCTSLSNMVAPKIKTVGVTAFSGSLVGGFPSQVEYVDNFAFDGASMTYIDLSKVTHIGMYAFRNTALLTSVVSVEKCTYIGRNAFEESGIESITPYCELQEYAFMNSNLEYVDLSHMPNGSILEREVFAGTKLKNITITSNIATIKSYAFYGATPECVYFEDDAATVVERDMFYKVDTTVKAVYFGPNVVVSSGALNGLAGIETVSIVLDNVENNCWYKVFGGDNYGMEDLVSEKYNYICW